MDSYGSIWDKESIASSFPVVCQNSTFLVDICLLLYGKYSRMNLEQYIKTAKNVLESILYYSKFNPL